jgi:hypothetical protein
MPSIYDRVPRPKRERGRIEGVSPYAVIMGSAIILDAVKD